MFLFNSISCGKSLRYYPGATAFKSISRLGPLSTSLSYIAIVNSSKLKFIKNVDEFSVSEINIGLTNTFTVQRSLSTVPSSFILKDLYAIQYRTFFTSSSFFFKNSKTSIRSFLPKAEDFNTALDRHADIKSRLELLKRPSTVKSWDQITKGVIKAIYNGTIFTGKFARSVPGHIERILRMPTAEWKKNTRDMSANIKHEYHHYRAGTKLLAYEVRIATGYAVKAAKGDILTRRERRQLTRTTADLFRLVPMIVIIVIPFLEFSLPVLLHIFPNMLPSTYEDKTKKEEELRRLLNVKLELAKFLQDTVSEMAKDIKERSTGEKARFAQGLNDFLNKVRAGHPVDNHEIIRFAQLFNDDLTLDNLERVQLVSMCQFVGISPFGTDQFLRSRLRQHLQQTKRDDYEIEQEGLENLTADELRVACRARGMRAPYGEGSVPFMTRNFRDWLDLSLHRGLPSSLLLLSRAFTITASADTDVMTKKELAYSKLKDTLGVLSDDVVESVELETAGAASTDVDSLTKKLEYLKREEEIIRQEAKVGKMAEAVIGKTADSARTARHGSSATSGLGSGGADSSSNTVAGAAVNASNVSGAVGNASATAAAAAATAGRGSFSSSSITTDIDSLNVMNANISLAEDEKLMLLQHERENKVKSLAVALINLASGGGVARERQYFMDLVNKEIDSINHTLTKQAEARSFFFSGKGLEVKNSADDRRKFEASSSVSLTSTERVSDRVTKLFESIERELESVESAIGNRMHVLDVDSDGVVTTDELERALGYIRTQLDPEDMQLLYTLLGAAAATQPEPKISNSIAVENLLTIAKGRVSLSKRSQIGSSTQDTV